jgi:membrane protease YdiL (CAAX protease family)
VCIGVSESESSQSGIDSLTAGSNKMLSELAVIMLVTVLLSIFIQVIKGVMMFLPLTYLIIEKRRTASPWTEFGIRREGYLNALKRNWHLIILVAFIIQSIVIVGASVYLPSFMEHIYSRIPWTPDAGIGALVGFLSMIIFVTFVEELVDRGFIQERFTVRFGPLIGIFMGSLFMTLMHWAPGDLFIVFLDLLAVFIDSAIFGLIYWRTRNIFVSWTAHLGVDIFDIVLMLLVF